MGSSVFIRVIPSPIGLEELSADIQERRLILRRESRREQTVYLSDGGAQGRRRTEPSGKDAHHDDAAMGRLGMNLFVGQLAVLAVALLMLARALRRLA